jgi:hypothetical protein
LARDGYAKRADEICCDIGNVSGGLHTNWGPDIGRRQNTERCTGKESHLLLPEIKRRMERMVKGIM